VERVFRNFSTWVCCTASVWATFTFLNRKQKKGLSIYVIKHLIEIKMRFSQQKYFFRFGKIYDAGILYLPDLIPIELDFCSSLSKGASKLFIKAIGAINTPGVAFSRGGA